MSVNAVSSADPERLNVLEAIRVASIKTGADFDYLLSTAMRESGLNTEAKTKSSSATGLFQFIDQTWLGLVKRYGARHGLAELADAITEVSGRYVVDSEDRKAAILALRKDAGLSALMAGEAAQETKQNLECALGREVCGDELYAAHFLGPANARKLIALNAEKPECLAAEAFPAAARANRRVFFNADGSPRTVREVYAFMAGAPQTASQAITSPAAPAAPGHKAEIAALPTFTPALSARGIERPSGAKAGAPPAFPSPPLRLSLGIIEVLAALPPPVFSFLRPQG